MRRVCIITLLALGAGAVPAEANDRFDDWQALRRLTQTAWQSQDLTPASNYIDGRFFASTNLNTAWDGVRSGSSSWTHPLSLGLPLLLMSEQAEEASAQNTQFAIDDFNLAQTFHSNMVGVVLGDEVVNVFGQGGLDHQRNIRDWLEINHPGLVTISSVLGGDNVADSAFVQNVWTTTINTVQSDVLMVQVYPYFGGGLSASYYRNMQYTMDFGQQHDVGIMVYGQAFGSTANDYPSESELRHQRFTSLAYGARGISDFLWFPNPLITHTDAGYNNGNNTMTPMGEQLAPINRELAYLGGSLVALTPTRAYHLDAEPGVHLFTDSDNDLPVDAQRSGLLTGVTSTNGNRAMVGFFKDAAGEEYFMVVNKDSDKSLTSGQLNANVTLSLDPSITSIQRLNRVTGLIEKLPVIGGQVTVSLAGGTGDLFKFNTNTPFALRGAPPVAKAVIFDNFDIYPSAHNDNLEDANPAWNPHRPGEGLAFTYGAQGPLFIGTGNGVDGSRAAVDHPSGNLWGSDRDFPDGPISQGIVTLTGNVSFDLPYQNLGSPQMANLILASGSLSPFAPLINFQFDGGDLKIEAGSLGGLPGSLSLTGGAGITGSSFDLSLVVDLDAQTLVASVTGDANYSTGLLNYNNAFAPGAMAILSRGFSGLSHTNWDDLLLTHLLPGDFDNDGRLNAMDIDLLGRHFGDARFDLTGNNQANFDDLQHLVEVRMNTFLGDANLDQQVNIADFFALQNNFGLVGGWADGDFNGDGVVNIADFFLLQNYFGSSNIGGAGASAADLAMLAAFHASLPEPGTLGLLVIGAVLVTRRRK